ncbi:hypothetical protein EYC84_009020 [Monilinia fructicola]|uniref:Uncharacterized protein n=1 Tax=Monilinia fructicola TaxID=38448 RepID=A0A5M9JCK1_MONFR|nr:hypothetical protein EYC84_009020 [Monilinia fructicola]
MILSLYFIHSSFMIHHPPCTLPTTNHKQPVTSHHPSYHPSTTIIHSLDQLSPINHSSHVVTINITTSSTHDLIPRPLIHPCIHASPSSWNSSIPHIPLSMIYELI